MADAKKTSEKSKPEAEKPPAKKDGGRETIESIVIAFIFAFLFRTFEAEAFVIPTGSMAPTLLGRHKDEACPKCGFEWTIGASEELDRETGTYLVSRIDRAVCPNCRFAKEVRNDPVFVGDRILVTKFNFEIGDPDRWDVTVFKYPEDPTTNYIKRLCGLPGETIEIRQGDLHRIDATGASEILRKPSGAKQLAVLQSVYDDDHPCREMLEAGWPERWAGVARGEGPNAVAGWAEAKEGWASDAQARSYRVEAGGRRWLRYRHFVPTASDWDDAKQGRLDAKARLILDFCGYNATLPLNHLDEGVYWVGDLAMTATAKIDEVKDRGKLVLELVEGGRRYRCTLDPAAGKAVLSYVDGLDREQRDEAGRVISEAAVDVNGPGEYELTFANVDDRLRLWVDGEEVEFPKADYEPYLGGPVQRPTADDLTPAGIAAENLTATVSHLSLDRDIYYRAEMIEPRAAMVPENRRQFVAGPMSVKEVPYEERLTGLADEPEVYAENYVSAAPWLQSGREWQYRMPLGEDEFLLLGDNSPRSQDSRLWGNDIRAAVHRHAVPRSALVGKALLIFWPHGLRWGNEKDGMDHGWTVRGLDRFFYHKRATPTRPGAPPRVEIVEDYPQHGVPFYPDFERILRRIR